MTKTILMLALLSAPLAFGQFIRYTNSNGGSQTVFETPCGVRVHDLNTGRDCTFSRLGDSVIYRDNKGNSGFARENIFGGYQYTTRDGVTHRISRP